LDPFRRRFALVGIAAVLLAGAVWALTQWGVGSRQYLPGPVTANHATFGDRCETCHDAFKNAPNERCLACHPGAVRSGELPGIGRVEYAHSAFAVDEKPCASCHLEHLGDSGLRDVPDVACVSCHGGLEARPGAPEIARSLTSFASHPEFAPLR